HRGIGSPRQRPRRSRSRTKSRWWRWSPPMKAPVLRRTRSDWLTVGIITAIATAAVGLTVANSDISHASLNPVAPPGAEHQPALLESAPDSLTEAFRVPNEGVPGVFKPIVVHGLESRVYYLSDWPRLRRRGLYRCSHRRVRRYPQR